MEFWTPRQIELVAAGQWLVPPSDGDAMLTGVSIDSRSIEPGQVFVALLGDRFDGHDFVVAAVERGAALVIAEDADAVKKLKLPHSVAVLHVQDTHTTLRQIARAYRGWLAAHDVTVIAVTGSNGKTTTRHLIHAAMSSGLTGTQSPKSFNNHIGVPLTLLGASEHDDFVVVEIGTNHPGEVAALGELVCPDAAVITSVGQEHMEFFGTLDAVAAEEVSIGAFVRPGGFVVVPPSPYLNETMVRDDLAKDVMWCCVGEVDISHATSETSSGLMHVTMNDGASFKLSLLGQHNAMNAALAFEVARRFGLEQKSIAGALYEVEPVPMRLQVQHIGEIGRGVTLINDAYNANPDSMREALAVLAMFESSASQHTKARRRIAVLGDMFELGDQAAHYHAELGREVARHANIDLACFIGNLSGLAAVSLVKVWPNERVVAWGNWTDELARQFVERLEPRDIVLIKASRGMALERLIPAIEARFAKDVPVVA